MKEEKEENLHLSIDKNLLTEKSSFEEFEENLKKAIFGVLFVLLRSEEFSFFAGKIPCRSCVRFAAAVQTTSLPISHAQEPPPWTR